MCVTEHNGTQYKVSSDILRAIHKKGFVDPTPVQSAVIPTMLSGTDVLVKAPTGTGKTAAFVIPILQALNKHNDDGE